MSRRNEKTRSIEEIDRNQSFLSSHKIALHSHFFLSWSFHSDSKQFQFPTRLHKYSSTLFSHFCLYIYFLIYYLVKYITAIPLWLFHYNNLELDWKLAAIFSINNSINFHCLTGLWAFMQLHKYTKLNYIDFWFPILSKNSNTFIKAWNNV